MNDRQWVVYILRCRDDTLYTGITDNLQRRLAAHGTARGAKYTRGRGPFALSYVQKCQDHSHALRVECQIKKMTRAEKTELCAGPWKAEE